jgi:hypothetical protein
MFWAPNDNIYSYVRNSLTSDYNTWFHTSATKSFNVPAAAGGAVDFATFRFLMQSVKANESHSVWADPGALSCTPF